MNYRNRTPAAASRHAIAVLFMAILACLLLFGMPDPAAAATRHFDVSMSPSMTSIKVTWRAQKQAKKYVIYRVSAEPTQNDDFPIPKLSAYKKVKTVKAKSKKKKLSWTDKKVKNGKYYTYVVKAFNKSGKEIASTFEDEFSASFACRGLGRAVIHNDGYGEAYDNSPKVLHLYVMQDYYGPSIKKVKVVIYRKAAGEKKYKKLATVKTKKKEYSIEYADKTVKPGTTYTYQAQIIKKYKGKTYKSKKSWPLTIPAVNFGAKYKVTCLTPAGTYSGTDKLEVTLSLQNQDKYNGVTTILPATGSFYDAMYCSEKGSLSGAYEFRFTMYSKDNSTWSAIPAKGIDLPKDAPIYLKGEILRGDSDAIYFGGSDSAWSSYIDSEGGLFNYQGPGIGYTATHLNLAKGTGGAYMEWD